MVKMWIVLGEEKGRIKLVSTNKTPAEYCQKALFLTVEEVKGTTF